VMSPELDPIELSPLVSLETCEGLGLPGLAWVL